MLKLLPIGAVLATIVSTQLPGFTSNQRLQLAQSPLLAEPYNSTSPENDPEGGILTTALVVGGIAAGGYLATTKANTAKSNTDSPIDQASSKLQKKLLILLHNDRTTANRLLAHTKQSNPQKSVNWAMEKVIYDLERDRA
ncbi:hypothetical protein [Chlorogloea sp. CCALA 695]|uniref:hypothetical protein n=1 Tax=Chlorogloea sp. CCALA 695 TaxID=2107693 RepID=UPI000D07415D|nr:hypothetical protein [Chlorogloea sp. CCALA 695]PSB34570.1 hypothetical protein C7B70_03695 [Chlorogloea sp. CCALA 695]